MFTAQVYRVMIGCLGGIMEEVHQAKMVVKEWNDENAKQTGKVFLPFDWSDNSDIINYVDIIVGIVGDWVDNARFIDKCIESGKKVVILYQKNHDPNNSIPGEIKTIRDFIERIKPNTSCFSFDARDEFKDLLLSYFMSIE